MLSPKNFLYSCILSFFSVLFFSSCTTLKLNFLYDSSEPLSEVILRGNADEKVLLIPVEGLITDIPEFDIINERPSMLQEIVAKLQLAAADSDIKAVILKVDSPGGSTTASDILYHEILKFKKQTNIKIITCMMNVGASGGYMLSLPSDFIMAHPTTITGSVGVIFVQPGLSGLMKMIGIRVDVTKSGRNKDMGSPFRPPTKEESELFQSIINQLNSHFLSLVKKHRKITPDSLKTIKTARVFLPAKAKKLGLVDGVGYLDDAIVKAAKLAEIPGNSRLVVYRRKYYAHDNVYNNAAIASGSERKKMLSESIPFFKKLQLNTGFYYLWYPER